MIRLEKCKTMKINQREEWQLQTRHYLAVSLLPCLVVSHKFYNSFFYLVKKYVSSILEKRNIWYSLFFLSLLKRKEDFSICRCSHISMDADWQLCSLNIKLSTSGNSSIGPKLSWTTSSELQWAHSETNSVFTDLCYLTNTADGSFEFLTVWSLTERTFLLGLAPE